jgi:hypothetical protein
MATMESFVPQERQDRERRRRDLLVAEAVAQRWVPWRISKSRVGCLLAEAVYARLAAIEHHPGVI